MNTSHGRLRRDLAGDLVQRSGRSMRIVVDDIAGRISRVSDDVWQSLQSGTANDRQWQQAAAAGWTRTRPPVRRATFSPLYFRIPLGSIDALAQRLVGVSGIVFSPRAVLVWSFLFLVTLVMLVSRSDQLSASLASMGSFFQQADAVALAGWFVVTKAIHELAHAVMCRRVGSRCGTVGILFLCGMPCPFCDVSNVVRHASRWSRAGVMLAGIYVEFIIATIAAIVWMNATDGEVQLHAMNAMIVCGISTLVFNANPLMRYDGYFVLSDWLDSVHLRHEAKQAFERVVVRPIAGTGYRCSASDRSPLASWGLSFYHAASSLYRVLVTFAIAGLLLTFADRLHLRSLMMMVVAIAAVAMAVRSGNQLMGIVRGRHDWFAVPAWRRFAIVSGGIVLALAMLLVPLPRHRVSDGFVDAVNAVNVFLPADGIVQSVSADFGDDVRAGQTLVHVRDDQAPMEDAKLRGQLRIARARRDWSQRQTVDRGDFAQQWATHHAVEDALQTQLTSVRRRIDRATVASPVAGVVLPGETFVTAKPLDPVRSLSDRVGTLGSLNNAWCRVSPDGRVWAVFPIDANDRHHITAGSPVRIAVPSMGGEVFESVVESVSPIRQDHANVLRRAAYEIVCPLPSVAPDAMLRTIGTPCHGIVALPRRSVAQDGWDWIGRWIRG
jgi:putative peptide zinc metalloprotease protein